MAQAQPLSTSADGVWHHLRLAPGLARPTQPVADGAPAAMVVQQGVLRWIAAAAGRAPPAQRLRTCRSTMRAAPGPRRG